MPWAARAGVDPAARLIFLSAMTWAIRFYVATMRLRQKSKWEWVQREESSQTCWRSATTGVRSSDVFWVWEGPTDRVICSRGAQPPYLKTIALKVTRYWLRRGESLTGLHAGVLFWAQDARFHPLLPKFRYWLLLWTHRHRPPQRGSFSLSPLPFVPITCPLIFLVAAFVSLSTMDALQREKRKSFVHG